MSENIMGSLEQRNADISTPDALQDWVLPVTWQPDDVHLQGVQVTQVIDDAVFVSSSETAVFQFTTGFRADPNPLHDLPHCNLNQICRDDNMHCVLCGLMEHVLVALLSHIIM
jgi:hypothetical protein